MGRKLSRAPLGSRLRASVSALDCVESTCMNMATNFVDQTRFQVRILVDWGYLEHSGQHKMWIEEEE